MGEVEMSFDKKKLLYRLLNSYIKSKSISFRKELNLELGINLNLNKISTSIDDIYEMLMNKNIIISWKTLSQSLSKEELYKEVMSTCIRFDGNLLIDFELDVCVTVELSSDNFFEFCIFENIFYGVDTIVLNKKLRKLLLIHHEGIYCCINY